MQEPGRIDPSQVRLGRPLAFRPWAETWAGIWQGRPVVVRRYPPPRPGAPWPLPPDIAGIAPPHPRVERLIGACLDPEGVTWHLFRLVPGRSLRQILNQGPLPLTAWLPLLADLAEGLCWLHEKSPSAPRLHGDISPGNLVVTPRGRGVLVDLRGDRPAEQLPPDRVLLGTLPYLADEVLAGRPPTPASEVASMGWLTCRVLCGPMETPPVTSPRDILRLRRVPEIPALGHITGLADLIGSMLAADPEQRPSARTVFLRLQAIRDETLGGVMAPHRGRPPRSRDAG